MFESVKRKLCFFVVVISCYSEFFGYVNGTGQFSTFNCDYNARAKLEICAYYSLGALCCKLNISIV